MKRIVLLSTYISIILLGCNSKKSNNTLENVVLPDLHESYIEKGKEITSSSFIALSTALTKSIKTGGLQNALSFCNPNLLTSS